MNKNIQIHITIIVFLCISVLTMSYVIWLEKDRGILTVAFLDVGQGDAIFIDSPVHGQILIDSGPNSSVLKELNKVIPWYDKTIDMIMVTNPDKDHIAGFIHVLKRYKVKKIIMPDTVNDTEISRTLMSSVYVSNLEKTIANRGQIIDLGGEVYIVILFPDRSVGNLDSNTGSIIAKLIYKNVGIALTGDAPVGTLNYIASLDTYGLKSNILKAGHHGSRTSAADLFVKMVNPDYAIISASKSNSYGHPHKETIDLFLKENISILGTYDIGTIIVESDGKSVWFR